MPDRFEIERLLQRIGHGVETHLYVGRLDSLHEAEMAFGQGEPGIARDAAKQPDADPVEGRPDHREMPSACDPVEDHAGDADVVAEVGTARRDRCRRLDLALDVEHQHDQPAKRRRDIGGAAAPARTVEQAQHAFGDGEVCRMARDEVGQ